MKQGYVKGTDTRILGTLETVQGVALVQGFNDGRPEYLGETRVYWDTQESIQRDGKVVYLCEDGEEHSIDEIEFREEDSRGDH